MSDLEASDRDCFPHIDAGDIGYRPSRRALSGQELLTEAQVFAYLVDLVRSGLPVSMVREAVETLRMEFNGGTGKPAMVAWLEGIEPMIFRGAATQTGVLVVSDNPIVGAGLKHVLSKSDVLCWSSGVDDVDRSTVGVWDYVLVWIQSAREIDAFGAIPLIRELGVDATSQVPVVAIHEGTISPFVRLRLAEAGARYVLPLAWLSANSGELSSLLITAGLPEEYHLETPFALRQKLGLKLDGDLAVLLEAACRVPANAWAVGADLDRIALSRSEIGRLRRIALECAGIPAPEFVRYASSIRRPPTTPEWPRVREVVREAWGLSSMNLH
ncbi:hypothetical protein [Arthrobacter sp. CJ23]|uniref:hypothetical protein n=1 Tax=Arthrobacter sp. CJ23 TaxID=2972479 RepID=UPI00215D36FE|nr:hypothetical protein [Arthrobacter sp. CJ23]UVJ38039.1 hypothetical protein NVV90_12285 [Arthrobacter sp. CJ23]